jgi:hypothetical protein
MNNGQLMEISANVVPTISGAIQRNPVNNLLRGKIEHLLNSVSMADTIPNEREITTVEILIGNDYYLDIVMPQRIEVHPGLYLLSSKLGWILTGRMNENSSDKYEFQMNSSMLILSYEANNQNTLTSIDNIMQRKPDLSDFWNIESIGIVDKEDSLGDKMAMEQFTKSLKFENNRYYVTWPWKDNNTDLPTNKELAKGRLNSCVKKLVKAPELLQKYDAIIQDQLNKGIIEKIDETMNEGKLHYTPHHAVITPQKTTTKVRIVYDASAKTIKEFSSLNESLYRGPVLLEGLCGLLIRFRTNKIAIVSDIEKAFLMVSFQKQDSNVTRFVWLKDINNPSSAVWCYIIYFFIGSNSASAFRKLWYQRSTENQKRYLC